MDQIFEADVWLDTTIAQSQWYPFNPRSVSEDLLALVPQKKYGAMEYLRMQKKLFPPGAAWNFPIGEESEY